MSNLTVLYILLPPEDLRPETFLRGLDKCEPKILANHRYLQLTFLSHQDRNRAMNDLQKVEGRKLSLSLSKPSRISLESLSNVKSGAQYSDISISITNSSSPSQRIVRIKEQNFGVSKSRASSSALDPKPDTFSSASSPNPPTTSSSERSEHGRPPGCHGERQSPQNPSHGNISGSTSYHSRPVPTERAGPGSKQMPSSMSSCSKADEKGSPKAPHTGSSAEISHNIPKALPLPKNKGKTPKSSSFPLNLDVPRLSKIDENDILDVTVTHVVNSSHFYFITKESMEILNEIHSSFLGGKYAAGRCSVGFKGMWMKNAAEMHRCQLLKNLQDGYQQLYLLDVGRVEMWKSPTILNMPKSFVNVPGLAIKAILAPDHDPISCGQKYRVQCVGCSDDIPILATLPYLNSKSRQSQELLLKKDSKMAAKLFLVRTPHYFEIFLNDNPETYKCMLSGIEKVRPNFLSDEDCQVFEEMLLLASDEFQVKIVSQQGSNLVVQVFDDFENLGESFMDTLDTSGAKRKNDANREKKSLKLNLKMPAMVGLVTSPKLFELFLNKDSDKKHKCILNGIKKFRRTGMTHEVCQDFRDLLQASEDDLQVKIIRRAGLKLVVELFLDEENLGESFLETFPEFYNPSVVSAKLVSIDSPSRFYLHLQNRPCPTKCGLSLVESGGMSTWSEDACVELADILKTVSELNVEIVKQSEDVALVKLYDGDEDLDYYFQLIYHKETVSGTL